MEARVRTYKLACGAGGESIQERVEEALPMGDLPLLSEADMRRIEPFLPLAGAGKSGRPACPVRDCVRDPRRTYVALRAAGL